MVAATNHYLKQSWPVLWYHDINRQQRLQEKKMLLWAYPNVQGQRYVRLWPHEKYLLALPWGDCLWRIFTVLYQEPGGRLNIQTSPYQYRDPMLKIRGSCDRLIFNMGIPIPGKDSLYIETEPSSIQSSATEGTYISGWRSGKRVVQPTLNS